MCVCVCVCDRHIYRVESPGCGTFHVLIISIDVMSVLSERSVRDSKTIDPPSAFVSFVITHIKDQVALRTIFKRNANYCHDYSFLMMALIIVLRIIYLFSGVVTLNLKNPVITI